MIIHLRYPFKINMNRLPYVTNHQEFLIAKTHASFLFFFFHFKVNVSELGLVTQGGKVVWGECHFFSLKPIIMSNTCKNQEPMFS